MTHTIETIKAWRTAEQAAGRNPGLEDYGRAHDVCLACLGKGHQQRMPSGTCPRCHGSGRYALRVQDQRP